MPYYYDDLDYYRRYGVYRWTDVYDPVYGRYYDPYYYPYSYYNSRYYYDRYYDDLDYYYRYRSPYYRSVWDPVLGRYVDSLYDPYYVPATPIRPSTAALLDSAARSSARRRAMSVGRY